jgi:hypothetical protein
MFWLYWDTFWAPLLGAQLLAAASIQRPMWISCSHGSFRWTPKIYERAPVIACAILLPLTRPCGILAERRATSRLGRDAKKSSRSGLFVSSTARHACRVFDVGPGITNKHIAIRHLDPGKSFGIKRRIRRQQTVEVKDVGGDRIDVVVA